MSLSVGQKRPRDDYVSSSSSLTVATPKQSALWVTDEDDERTSKLSAPIMLLTGHEAAVYCFKFSPNGEVAASAGSERDIMLWEVYGSCQNFNVMRGHKNAVLELQWFADGRSLASCSADKTLHVWDAHLGRRKKKYAGHTGVVNSVCVARQEDTLVSGGDDCNVLLWDCRARSAVRALKTSFAVTAVAFSEDAETVFSAGIDECVTAWDLRKDAPIFELKGHSNTITSLALSPDGTQLLSNGMDSKLHCWDVSSFASSERLVKTFLGGQHDFHKNLLKCAWSSDGEKVTAGSSDQIVHVWDVATTEELYYLPGHKGCVNEVDFHPKEPIIGSCSSDRTIYLGEIAA